MKIAIVVVARDADTVAFFKQRRGSVIPKTVSGSNNRFNVVVIDACCSDEELFQGLIKMHVNHDAVGVLIENCDESRLNKCTCAIFRKTFSSVEAKSKNSLQNYFTSNMTRWLKNFIFLVEKFNEGKNRKCLMLPERSFSAPELSEIFQLCLTKNDEGSFTHSLEERLKLLRNRSNPKKHQHDKNRKEYLVDDVARHFDLGKDRHGQSETKRPPHKLECEYSAWSRFGVTMDRLIHYNVSLAGSAISGNFQNCHSTTAFQEPCTHINMFPNGFIR